MSGDTVMVFIGLTVVVVGGAGVLTGQALARNWRPAWQVVFACFGLGFVDRFLSYALFDQRLLDPLRFVIDTLVIMAMALIAYRISRVTGMVKQYPWEYERSGPFAYREKS
ncbi:MAG: hypothetical protein CMM50_12290 [Rhodospirillaceae bacterium]|nr:hypothetical protein [Rhodospirillaceae bacterium]